eukprot:CAMPEP_0197865246 /NCGR_PEP_ID=MMETSP1438-20131217/43555_1 /TAXON_ID=1461541 /ORGANISM="Pterosperma sp., Strain CCMP1384" /LENGTH=233 /DNA_ID=CAMNT_0043483681 /DNA_START=80 /DNA_END=781 /DNA_ORIENTATION=+
MQAVQHLPPAGNPCLVSKEDLRMEAEEDEEEIAALEAALKLNEELKQIEAAMAAQAMDVAAQAMEEGPVFLRDPMQTSRTPSGRDSRQPHPKSPSKKSKQTFTSAPDSIKQIPKGPAPRDYSHNDHRLNDIGRQNAILSEKLQSIHLRDQKRAEGYVPNHLKAASVAPSHINRKKAGDKIAQENARMHARLQSIKPTAGLKNKNLQAEHKQAQKHAALRRQVKPIERPPWTDR